MIIITEVREIELGETSIKKLNVHFLIDGYRWSLLFPLGTTKEGILQYINDNYDDILRWAKEGKYDWGKKVSDYREDLMDVKLPTSEFKLSVLYGLTREQIGNHIDNQITNLATAKEYLKKLSAVVLYLVRHTKLDE